MLITTGGCGKNLLALLVCKVVPGSSFEKQNENVIKNNKY
jgi:hypothetical protein